MTIDRLLKKLPAQLCNSSCPKALAIVLYLQQYSDDSSSYVYLLDTFVMNIINYVIENENGGKYNNLPDLNESSFKLGTHRGFKWILTEGFIS